MTITVFWSFATLSYHSCCEVFPAGVSFSSCFFQPPIIFPISSRGIETAEYFFAFIAFNSNAICKKNFMASIVVHNSRMSSSFSSRGAYFACNMSCNVSVNNMSILAPSENLVSRGICCKNKCQSLYASTALSKIGIWDALGGGLPTRVL